MWGRMRRPFSSAAELGTSSSPHSCKRRTDTAVGPARAGEYRAVLPSKWQCLEEKLSTLGQLFTEDCVHCNREEKPVTLRHTLVRYMKSSCKTQSKHFFLKGQIIQDNPQNIARIANAVQCHNQLPGKKDCHESNCQYCGFCLSRILLYFHMCVCPCVRVSQA